MGLGRYVATKVANAIFLMFVVALMMAGLFLPAIDKLLWAYVDEVYMQTYQAYLKKGFSPSDAARFAELEKQRMIEYYGLNKPIFERIIRRAIDLFLLRFGKSLQLQGPEGTRYVTAIILSRIPATMLLFTTATIIVAIIGLKLGLSAAKKPGSTYDKAIAIYSLVSYSIPMWWIGMLFLLVFAYYLGIFPLGKITSEPSLPESLAQLGLLGRILDVLWHLALPLMTLVLVSLGGWAYIVRNIVIDIMTQDYIKVARAKGLPESRIMYHVTRAAAPPIVTMVVLSVISSLTGAIITETVFSWEGMGMLYWSAISAGDFPVVLGLTYIFGVINILAILISEIIYGVLDPRIRVG